MTSTKCLITCNAPETTSSWWNADKLNLDQTLAGTAIHGMQRWYLYAADWMRSRTWHGGNWNRHATNKSRVLSLRRNCIKTDKMDEVRLNFLYEPPGVSCSSPLQFKKHFPERAMSCAESWESVYRDVRRYKYMQINSWLNTQEPD